MEAATNSTASNTCRPHSQKSQNHTHVVALFALYYNFVRIPKTLKVTPATGREGYVSALGIGDILWVWWNLGGINSSGWYRVLVVCAGVLMIVGALLELEGYRRGRVLVAVAGAFAVGIALRTLKPQSK